jgi:hypothetical protein
MNHNPYTYNIEDFAEFFISKFSDYMRNNFTFNIQQDKIVVEENNIQNDIKADIIFKQDNEIK